MRLTEILNEGVTFGVARLEDHDGRKIYSDPFMVKTEEECFVCHGSGKETFGGYTDEDGTVVPKFEENCGLCKGKGTTDEWRSTAGELNVSNANAFAIQEMLGITDPDYAGHIEQKDFPEIKRRLIKLKNTDISPHVQTPTKSGGEMRIYKDAEGQSSIGRGLTSYDLGRSQSQVERYIDTLLKLLDFAQKNNCDLVWG